MGVDFRVWGSYRSPRTDLQDRVLRGFAESLLKKGLKQFLRCMRRAGRAGCPRPEPSAIVTRIMARGRVFFGWWVAPVFSVVAFLSAGIRFAVGPFLKPMVGRPRSQPRELSLVISLGLLLYGSLHPFVGRLMDRLGARTVAVGGAVLLGGSLVGQRVVSRLWHLYLWFGMGFAMGLAATGPVVGSAVLRAGSPAAATALSVIGSASMAGMRLCAGDDVAGLTLGWRATYGFSAASVLVRAARALLRARLARSDGAGARRAAVGTGQPAPSALERTISVAAFAHAPFWQLRGGVFTCGFSMSLLSRTASRC